LFEISGKSIVDDLPAISLRLIRKYLRRGEDMLDVFQDALADHPAPFPAEVRVICSNPTKNLSADNEIVGLFIQPRSEACVEYVAEDRLVTQPLHFFEDRFSRRLITRDL
jgi:hypothetical protein